MSSSSILDAELQVAGHRAACTATIQQFRQATDHAGRPSSSVGGYRLEVTLTGHTACWPVWTDLSLNSFRRESGHLFWRTEQGRTVRRLTFYEAACTRLGFEFDARGQAKGEPAVRLTLRFSPAAVELDGQ